MPGLFTRGSQRTRSNPGPGTDLSDLIAANDLVPVDDLDPEARRQATADRYSPVLLIIAVLATLGVLAYAFFLLNPANRGDLLPWLIVMAAETVLIFHALMAMWTMLAGYGRGPTFGVLDAQKNLFDPRRNERLGVTDDPTRWPLHLNGEIVSVDVLITVYGEPLDVIRRTVDGRPRDPRRAPHLDPRRRRLGRRPRPRRRAAEPTTSAGSGNGAKAGNINHALTVAKGEYFAIFDADFVPKPEFLDETLPVLHRRRRRLRADAAGLRQPEQPRLPRRRLHADGVLPVRPAGPEPLQRGILRRHERGVPSRGDRRHRRHVHRLQVGGRVDLADAARARLALGLHPRRLAVGDAPETIEDYTKQQLRWATGGFEILMHAQPALSRARKLTLDQRLMYFVTATHYLTGIAAGLLLMVPPLEIFFDLRPVNLAVGPLAWVLFYAGFYVPADRCSPLTLGSFRWEVLLLRRRRSRSTSRRF